MLVIGAWGTQAAGSRGEAQNPFPGSYYMRWPVCSAGSLSPKKDLVG